MSSSNARTAEIELACLADRNRLQCCVEHVAARVREGPANRDTDTRCSFACGVFLQRTFRWSLHFKPGRKGRRLGWAVGINETSRRLELHDALDRCRIAHLATKEQAIQIPKHLWRAIRMLVKDRGGQKQCSDAAGTDVPCERLGR